MGANEGQEGVGLNPTIDFVAGTISGMTSLVVGFPFDTVKVRFQSPAIAGKYHSTFNAITTIIREERFIGLYKGITSPLATVALMNGLVFASYRLLLKLQLPNAGTLPTIAQIALAGAGSGIISSIVTTPTELIKIRQQATLTPTTARQMALQILREGGLPSLYRGLTATALRDCGYGAYFAVYEATCRYFSRPTGPSEPSTILDHVETEITQLSWGALLLAGGLAGVAGWVATFPFDVVKTRVQGSQPMPVISTAALALPPGMSQPLLARDIVVKDMNPYRTTLSTIIHSYRNEGVGVFFRGLSPTLIRAIPVNMVTFATFEAMVHFLS
ncbi:hypothetical protein GALMADRAFT_153318 [Galerina marginata CBS 339.88]|uniref:Mitochondrial carrier protein n=1 Tax=Galerina marginata (strain CBS 339.88) TaxID=685588 RepID=A0A067TCP9_GALM3|nr:hypothetical protein GALMADRAFT_153318 [Galerina marginata CBS 339.88]